MHDSTVGQRNRVLWLSTISFTLLFAIWLMLGMLSIRIKPELSLTDGQLYNLTIAAILSGSLLRFHFGVWTDQYGGRVVLTALLLLTVIPTYFVSRVTNYEELLICACLYGVAGNSFAVGIAWNAAWFPSQSRGLALGIFGAGNVGASVTKLFGPFIIASIPTAGFLSGIIPGGWRAVPVIYTVLLLAMAAAVWFIAPKHDRRPGQNKTVLQMASPAKYASVWEYSLYYVVVFGAYVALSNVLPKFYLDNYGSELAERLSLSSALVENFKAINALKGDEYAAYMAAHPDVKTDLTYLVKWVGLLSAICYVFPASLLRPLGGYLSDRLGASRVMAAVFIAMLASGLMLSIPGATNVVTFTIALFVLGSGMGIGKASVYKMIPDRFPAEIGAVGGLVGLLGALGGVLLPISWGVVNHLLAPTQVIFGSLLVLTAISLVWFVISHTTISRQAAETPVETAGLVGATTA